MQRPGPFAGARTEYHACYGTLDRSASAGAETQRLLDSSHAHHRIRSDVIAARIHSAGVTCMQFGGPFLAQRIPWPRPRSDSRGSEWRGHHQSLGPPPSTRIPEHPAGGRSLHILGLVSRAEFLSCFASLTRSSSALKGPAVRGHGHTRLPHRPLFLAPYGSDCRSWNPENFPIPPSLCS